MGRRVKNVKKWFPLGFLRVSKRSEVIWMEGAHAEGTGSVRDRPLRLASRPGLARLRECDVWAASTCTFIKLTYNPAWFIAVDPPT